MSTENHQPLNLRPGSAVGNGNDLSLEEAPTGEAPSYEEPETGAVEPPPAKDPVFPPPDPDPELEAPYEEALLLPPDEPCTPFVAND